LGVQSWSASGDPPVQAIDSLTTTRYTTGEAMNVAAHALVVDMTGPLWIDGVKLDHTTPTAPGTDKLLGYEIDVSMDKTTWKPVACGTNAATVADIGFTSTQARYVKIIQLLTTTPLATTSWWSVYDLQVYLGAVPEAGPPDAEAGPDAPEDVSADAPEDVSVDATPDAEVDAGTDAEVDTGTDAEVDASAD
jgi:hypothetical protein